MTDEELAAHEATLVREADAESLTKVVAELHRRGELARSEIRVQALVKTPTIAAPPNDVDAGTVRELLLSYLETPEATFSSFMCNDTDPDQPSAFAWIDVVDEVATLRVGACPCRFLREEGERGGCGTGEIQRLQARGAAFAPGRLERRFAWFLAWAAWDGKMDGRVRPNWAWFPPGETDGNGA
ncbi:MAG: hypothetical protein HYZ53_07985 [Planctomycetes bacterium]|nr:hypothetical protein [Planctomycetota bacterium]